MILSEIEMAVKIPSTRGKTERPRAPLLQLGSEPGKDLCRIGGRLRRGGASPSGAALEIPPLFFLRSNLLPLSGIGTLSGGQFDWGGRLLKSNGGAQWFPQPVWKSGVECKGIREPDCKRDISSRYESRS